MLNSVKGLIAVVAIALVIFKFSKPLGLLFSTERDFVRRRNIWFVLTAAALLSGGFWTFCLVAVPVLIWAGRVDSNPVALYLLLMQIVPQVAVPVPMVGMGYLFQIDFDLLMSLCILIPVALRLRQSKNGAGSGGLKTMDYLLIAYGVLEIVLFVRPDMPGHVILQDSMTNKLRRTFMFVTDVYVLYFVVSRFCNTRERLKEAMAAFCLACALMSGVAVFESAKHWSLYTNLAMQWSNDPALGFYLFRGDSLRALASAGHPLALGYLLAMALGFWLYLQSAAQSKKQKIGVALLLWAGLLAAYSRGPWVGAAAIYVCFAALSPRAVSRLSKVAFSSLLIGGLLSMTPIGERIIRVLPFLGGSVDSANISYRQRLSERAWDLVMQSPFFGDQFAVFKMDDLRQGQGIVDLVNTYVQVALDKGLIGLALFVGFILIGCVGALRSSRSVMRTDPDLGQMGTSLVCCIIGTLILIQNCSFIMGYAKMFYVLAGLATGYIGVAARQKQPVASKAGLPSGVPDAR